MNQTFARDTLQQGGSVEYGGNTVQVRERREHRAYGTFIVYEVRYNGAPMEAYPLKSQAVDNALRAIEHPEAPQS